jgi:hypothetical protein
MMKKVCSILLVGVGLLNLIPVIGVLSAEQLTNMYGISITTPDLETLMRHRAVMLGLIGGFLLLAAFRSSLQIVAASMGLLSMASFVVLAYLSGDIGTPIDNVVIADIVGSVAAVIALVIAVREGRGTD